MKKSMLCAGLITVLSTAVCAESNGSMVNVNAEPVASVPTNTQLAQNSASTELPVTAQIIASGEVKTPSTQGLQLPADKGTQTPSTTNPLPASGNPTPTSTPMPAAGSSNTGTPSSSPTNTSTQSSANAQTPGNETTKKSTATATSPAVNAASPANNKTSEGASSTNAPSTTTPTTDTSLPASGTATPASPTPALNTAPVSGTAPSTNTTSPTNGSANPTTSGTPTSPAPSAPGATTTAPATGTPSTATPAATPPQPLNCTYRIPAETTHIEQTIVMKWAEKAAEQSFDFDHDTIDSQLAALKSCYTEQGWQGFNDALQKSGNLNAIKSQQLTVSSMVNGESKITEIKDNQWKVSIPMQVVYQNDKEKLTQPLTVNLVVGRKISGDLGIMQMIAIPSQTTSTDNGTTPTASAPGTTTAPITQQPNQP